MNAWMHSANQDAEVRRLAGMLSKMDEDALKQRKEYDQVICRRGGGVGGWIIDDVRHATFSVGIRGFCKNAHTHQLKA